MTTQPDELSPGTSTHDESDLTPASPEPSEASPGTRLRLRTGLKAGDVYLQYPRGSNTRP